MNIGDTDANIFVLHATLSAFPSNRVNHVDEMAIFASSRLELRAY